MRFRACLLCVQYPKNAKNRFTIEVGEEKMGRGKVVGGIIAVIVIAVAVMFALDYFQIFTVPVLGSYFP